MIHGSSDKKITSMINFSMCLVTSGHAVAAV